ncbi:sensor histidine kinase [Pedobacter sp. Du54]|uniref:tetratricopeptide repeat-containing sensor histidine kinase n=1 Tax=Pedobacter anseongensis TaxID=3133439 RepID=UPI0030A8F8F3
MSNTLFCLFSFIILKILFLSNPTFAQRNPLLDSAQHIFRAHPDKATEILKQVKFSADKAKDYYALVNADIILGNIAYFSGKHEQALKIYLTALHIAEKSDRHELIAAVCNEIGTLLKKNKSLKDALAYYTRSLNEASLAKNNSLIANAYNNIGLVYEEKGDYKKALSQYQFSLNAYRKVKEKLGESYSLEYIGYVYSLMKNYPPAIENLEKSLALRREIKDNYGIAICLTELTEVYNAKGEVAKAIAYGKQAITFSKGINYPDMLQNAYLLLSKIYEENKEFDEAYAAHKKYVSVKDSIFNATKSEQISELQTKYETEKKLQQISLLNKENTIQKLKLSQRDFVIMAIISLFILAIFISYLIYNRYRLKQDARLQQEVILQQDLATKAVLQAEEVERKRISGELHDGLGQMFSAVKMNLSALADHLQFEDNHAEKMFEKTLSLVDESCREVRVISHQMAPNILLKSGLATALHNFIDKIDARKLKINLSTFGLNERLDQNVEMVLYRVIQEAVNNVIKHAEANSLAIQLTKEEESITVMIEDNGRGFDRSSLDDFEGVGLKNIRTRVEYLKGQVDFSSTPGAGTLVAIFIPL